MKLKNEIVSYKIKKGYIKNENFNHKFILYKGNKKYKIKISDVLDKEIIFKEIYNDGNKKIILNKINKNNKNKIYECIAITIKDNIAELDKLQVSEDTCIDVEDFGLKTTGKFHLKVAIKMLKKYKEKFKITIFSLSKKNLNDESQNELRSLCEQWFDVEELDNLNLAKIIQKQKIIK